MAKLHLNELEATYEQMGEAFLGSVRSGGDNAWFWESEGSVCIYRRDTATQLRLLRSFRAEEGGGVSGRMMLFTPDRILRAGQLALTADEYWEHDMPENVLELRRMEDSLGFTQEITDTDYDALIAMLNAPLEELKSL